MKSLKERKAGREKDRAEAIDREDFQHATFMNNGRDGSNQPGMDRSQGSTEGTDGDATRVNSEQNHEGEVDGPTSNTEADKTRAINTDGGGDHGGATVSKRKSDQGEGGAGGAADNRSKPKGDAAKAREQEGQVKSADTGWGGAGMGGNAGEAGKTSKNPQS